MTNSVARKAAALIKDGNVNLISVAYNSFSAVVITKDADGNPKTHHIVIWRDGRYSCECDHFLKSKSIRLDLWSSNLLLKAECKHALAVKLTDQYERWIRMIKERDVDGTYLLRAVENPEESIHVKSLEEGFDHKRLVKKRVAPSSIMKRKGIIDQVIKDK